MSRTIRGFLAAAALLAGQSCAAGYEGRAVPATESLDESARGFSFSHFGEGDDGDTRARTESFFNDASKAPERSVRLADLPAEPAARDRMMVYRGAMGVEVARVEESIARFLGRVQEWGGYLSARNDDQVTVRVPAQRFPEVMAELRSYGRVLAESMEAEDVTKQHMDLSIRLENARKSRERMLALLERAEKVEDILKIEEQLQRLTTEIERMEGELKWLGDQVAMSTVQAGFQAVAAQRPDHRPTQSRFPWINALGPDRLRRDF